MKKNLILIYLVFLYISPGSTNEISLKLFGIKIYDNVKNYININTEKKPKKNFFLNTKETPFKGLIKDSKLNAYQLSTNKDDNILIITGLMYFSEVGNKNYKNECENESNSFKILFANNFKKDLSKFNKKYYKNSNAMGRDYLFFSNELRFNKDTKRLILQIMCSYTSIDNYVHSTLYISLIDENYWLQNSLEIWKRIKPHNDILVELNL